MSALDTTEPRILTPEEVAYVRLLRTVKITHRDVSDLADSHEALRARLAAVETERDALRQALHGLIAWVERESWTPPDSYSQPDTDDGAVVTAADLLAELRAALAAAEAPPPQPTEHECDCGAVEGKPDIFAQTYEPVED